MATSICKTNYPGLRLEAQLCFKLHSATSRFFGRFDRLLRAHGLTFTEYIILLMVWEEGPVDETAVAERLRLDPYTIEEGMVNLERQRRISRSENSDELGNRVVEATRDSYALQPELNAAREGFLCDSGLPEGDWRALGVQLDKMSEALAQMDLDRLDRGTAAVEKAV